MAARTHALTPTIWNPAPSQTVDRELGFGPGLCGRVVRCGISVSDVMRAPITKWATARVAGEYQEVVGPELIERMWVVAGAGIPEMVVQRCGAAGHSNHLAFPNSPFAELEVCKVRSSSDQDGHAETKVSAYMDCSKGSVQSLATSKDGPVVAGRRTPKTDGSIRERRVGERIIWMIDQLMMGIELLFPLWAKWL